MATNRHVVKRKGWLSRLGGLFSRGPQIDAAPKPDVALSSRIVVYERGSAPLAGEAVQAHAAARWDPAASWLPAFVQDASQDNNAGDRLEIMRRARYCEQWSALINKILWLIDINVIGTGVMPSPTTSSKRFNKRALDYFHEVAPVLDITETIPFALMQSIMARAYGVDGEMFNWLTYADDEKLVPRVRMIEAHRITSAQVERYRREGYTEFDGILFDQNGRPEFYIVSNDYDAFSTRRPGSVAMLPRGEVCHVFRPRRTGQPRGLSLFAPILHDAHDLDDLQMFEMVASKDASSRTRTVYNETGEAPKSTNAPIGRTRQVMADDGTIEDRTLYYKREFGGKTVYLKHGDKSEIDAPLRPTAAQQEFWDRLERKVSQGVGISLAAVMDYAGQWGGASVRGAVANDNRFYDQVSWTLIPHFQRIWEHIIGAGIRAGRLGVVPSDWRACAWNPPRRTTVDIGRDGKQLLAELEAGLRVERDLVAELGYDYREIRAQRLTEVSERLEDAEVVGKRFKLPTMTAYALLQKPGEGIYSAAQADTQPTDPKGPSSQPSTAPAEPAPAS